MGQVTRVFKIWEVYLGGENLLNYTQHHVILGSEIHLEIILMPQIWGRWGLRMLVSDLILILKIMTKLKI
ncbi:MAG: hypothetical protein IPJ26_15985 [Bacteroidetes bacterium]|nr:hypothetical protein [Bacteroidota bacterium]